MQNSAHTYAAFNSFRNSTTESGVEVNGYYNGKFHFGRDVDFNFGRNLFQGNAPYDIFERNIKKNTWGPWSPSDTVPGVGSFANFENNLWMTNPGDILTNSLNHTLMIDSRIFDNEEDANLKPVDFSPVALLWAIPPDFDGMFYPEDVVRSLGICEFKSPIAGHTLAPTGGFPDCLDDSDNDQFPLIIDNCPNQPNTSLKDSDMDGIGNDCDQVPINF